MAGWPPLPYNDNISAVLTSNQVLQEGGTRGTSYPGPVGK